VDQYTGLDTEAVEHGIDGGQPLVCVPLMHPELVVAAADAESSQPVGYAPLIHPQLVEGATMVAGDAESSQPVGYAPLIHPELVEAGAARD